MHLPVQSNPCNTDFAEPYQKKGSYGIQNLCFVVPLSLTEDSEKGKASLSHRGDG